jgi:hypothetical protein
MHFQSAKQLYAIHQNQKIKPSKDNMHLQGGNHLTIQSSTHPIHQNPSIKPSINLCVSDVQ